MCSYSFNSALTSGALLFRPSENLSRLHLHSAMFAFLQAICFHLQVLFHVIFQFTIVCWLFYVHRSLANTLNLSSGSSFAYIWNDQEYSRHHHLKCMDPTISNALFNLKFLGLGEGMKCESYWRRPANIREFTKTRRQRQRERHQTKGLMS